MRRKICAQTFLAGVLVLIASPSFSQRNIEKGVKTPFEERIYTGGYFGLALGPTKFFDISPYSGCMINNRLSLGAGVTLQYESYIVQVNGGKPFKVKSNRLGARIFGRYNLNKFLFAWLEHERINTEVYDFYYNDTGSVWVRAVYLGGGFSKSFGENKAITITSLYDLLNNEHGHRNTPLVIRLGLVF